MSIEVSERPSAPRFNRRTALRLGAAGVPLLAGLALPATASAAPGRPTGAAYVRYEDLYRSGDSLQGVINRVTGNRILTLPEGNFSFRDFRQGNYDGIRIGTDTAAGCRGLVGSGRNTVIRGTANTATRDKGSGICGNQMQIANKSNAVLSNFSLKGNPQNGMYYAGLVVNYCPDAQVSWLYLQGASRGWSQRPPGETFAINVMNSPRVTVADTEIDGRDDTGKRVGASPIGWNNTTDAKIYRTYVHHGLAGMVSFYEVVNVYTEDFHCYSTSSGSGDLTGSGINHEQSSGAIKHVRPILMMNGKYTTTADHTLSNGPHMSFANIRTDLTNVQILEPNWDRNLGTTGMFTMSCRDGYNIRGVYNKIKTPPKIVKNGVTLLRSDHPTSGYGSKDPKKYFIWIH